jgi:RNase P subunit RPR2
MIKLVVLRVIKSAPEGYRLIAPGMPVTLPSETNHYVCGHCSTLLAVSETNQLRRLVIKCRECGALNEIP